MSKQGNTPKEQEQEKRLESLSVTITGVMESQGFTSKPYAITFVTNSGALREVYRSQANKFDKIYHVVIGDKNHKRVSFVRDGESIKRMNKDTNKSEHWYKWVANGDNPPFESRGTQDGKGNLSLAIASLVNRVTLFWYPRMITPAFESIDVIALSEELLSDNVTEERKSEIKALIVKAKENREQKRENLAKAREKKTQAKA